MYWKKFFYCLYFDDDPATYQQVDSESDLQPYTVIVEGKCELLLYKKSGFFQFVGKTSFVSTFQKSWPKRRMDVHSRAKYGFANTFVFG